MCPEKDVGCTSQEIVMLWRVNKGLIEYVTLPVRGSDQKTLTCLLFWNLKNFCTCKCQIVPITRTWLLLDYLYFFSCKNVLVQRHPVSFFHILAKLEAWRFPNICQNGLTLKLVYCKHIFYSNSVKISPETLTLCCYSVVCMVEQPGNKSTHAAVQRIDNPDVVWEMNPIITSTGLQCHFRSILHTKHSDSYSDGALSRSLPCSFLLGKVQNPLIHINPITTANNSRQAHLNWKVWR